jgi:hypothetical protein
VRLKCAIGASTVAFGWVRMIVHFGVENAAWRNRAQWVATYSTDPSFHSKCPAVRSLARRVTDSGSERAEPNDENSIRADSSRTISFTPGCSAASSWMFQRCAGLTAPWRVPRSGCRGSSARLRKNRTWPAASGWVDSTVLPAVTRACC